ncbi:MAG: YhjD/YihY/BrkB family envelope integrity protein [Pyrinomonadaceae bacterium]
MVLFSIGFRVYLHYFNSYSKTYGSVGAIIILLLWLYLTALVILIGGTINAVLDEFSRGKYDKNAAAKDAPNRSDTQENKQ